MRAAVIKEFGEPEVFSIEQREKPCPETGQLLVRVHYAGINRPDIFQRLGKYPAPKGVPPDVPGLEISGVVEEAATGTSRFKKGDKVCALLAGGGYSEYVTVPEQLCLPVPKGLSLDGAAALPETFFTVWSNVFDRASFVEGESVLIHGGASGIGVAAIQMVSAFGGKVFTTAGSQEKCRLAEKLGAIRAINYHEEDFEEALKKEVPEGVDIILDMVGGDYLGKNINLLREEGRLVIINAVKDRNGQADLLKIMVRRLMITGSTLRPRDLAFKHEIAKKLEAHVWPKLEQGVIRPVIYQTFPLEEVAEAHRLMESGKHTGKVLLSCVY